MSKYYLIRNGEVVLTTNNVHEIMNARQKGDYLYNKTNNKHESTWYYMASHPNEVGNGFVNGGPDVIIPDELKLLVLLI